MPKQQALMHISMIMSKSKGIFLGLILFGTHTVMKQGFIHLLPVRGSYSRYGMNHMLRCYSYIIRAYVVLVFFINTVQILVQVLLVAKPKFSISTSDINIGEFVIWQHASQKRVSMTRPIFAYLNYMDLILICYTFIEVT